MKNGETILTGRKRISTFVGRSWATIHKWIKKDNFPATKIDGVWESDTNLIYRWRQQRILNKDGAN
jgi:hypothetical protein